LKIVFIDDQVKIKSLRWVLIIKRGHLNAETETHMGRTPCEREGEDFSDVSTSPGLPKISQKPPEARKEV
jgi:hypothetical protein